MDNFNIHQILPLLQSLGISPEQLGPEKLAFMQKLAEIISDPSKIGSQEASNLLREIGIGTKSIQPKKNKYKKINRNETCPCGSHKKYKKCCGF